MFQKYLNEVFQKYKKGDSSERNYYSTLESFLKEFEKASISVEPRNSSVGIPDFKVENEKGLLFGYIEAKDVIKDLDKLTKSEYEQINKYRKEYPKLIVTNFIEFRLYKNSELVDSVIITQPVTLKIGTPVLENEGRARGVFERFFSTTIPSVYTSKHLSELLAYKTRVLKGLILEEIDLGDDITTTTEELYDVFKRTLRPVMKPEEFSDMYAQAITFGLFVARINSNGKVFNRRTAFDYIPLTIPLLRRLFYIISGQTVPQHIKWQVDEIAEILGNADIEKIKTHFFSEGKGRDPIIHFYETFLEIYDPEEREKLGVYYTPNQVVRYITKSINELLKVRFEKTEGFADPSVSTLDPAAGTLTFPAEAIALAKDEFTNKYADGSWGKLVKDHILENFYAFEVLMAPYAIGHLKISLLMQDLGYRIKENEQFKLYLTNTLDIDEIKKQELLLAPEISLESKNAFKVKTKKPILVIFGNPPYSVSSSNIIKEGTRFYDLYNSYKESVRKEERNIQPLSDDYIKFIAFGHWKIKETKTGIMGMITNNSYLEGLIHRDMRRKLFEDFEEIYVLNLHGSSKKGEKTPEGGKDENVFDIQQGVSIIMLVKKKGLKKQIKYYDLWGLRKKKLNFLEKKSVLNTSWQEIRIELFNEKFKNTRWGKKYSNGPYLFTPKTSENILAYGNYYGLDEIFLNFNSGIATGKDDVLVNFDKESLLRNFMSNDKITFELAMQGYGISKNLSNIWYKEIHNKNIEEQITSYNYRPFDVRFTVYNSKLLQRARTTLMDNLINKKNLALVSTKILSSDSFNHVFISETIGDRCLMSNRGSETNYYFPLNFDSEIGKKSSFLFEQQKLDLKGTKNTASSSMDKISNINTEILEFLKKFYKININPEKAFHYIYAILYSVIYREKYLEFLKMDFPRIPFTNSLKLFRDLSNLGEKLLNLHLFKVIVQSPNSKFYGQDGNKIEKIIYKETDKKLYINNNQYFSNVETYVWNYYIGGYKVLSQWLKYRKDKSLSAEEVKHFCKMVFVLTKTIEIQKEIDRLYPKVEESL